MGDEDIRKRSILKQTAAYLPAQMPEAQTSYIHSQDFEGFFLVHVTAIENVLMIYFESENSVLPSIYRKRATFDFCLIVRGIQRITTYHKYLRQIRTNPYPELREGSPGEQDQTLKKSKKENQNENFQDKRAIANC